MSQLYPKQVQQNFGRTGGWLTVTLYIPGPWDTRWQLLHSEWTPWKPSA